MPQYIPEVYSSLAVGRVLAPICVAFLLIPGAISAHHGAVSAPRWPASKKGDPFHDNVRQGNLRGKDDAGSKRREDGYSNNLFGILGSNSICMLIIVPGFRCLQSDGS